MRNTDCYNRTDSDDHIFRFLKHGLVCHQFWETQTLTHTILIRMQWHVEHPAVWLQLNSARSCIPRYATTQSAHLHQLCDVVNVRVSGRPSWSDTWTQRRRGYLSEIPSYMDCSARQLCVSTVDLPVAGYVSRQTLLSVWRPLPW